MSTNILFHLCQLSRGTLFRLREGGIFTEEVHKSKADRSEAHGHVEKAGGVLFWMA